MFRLFFLPRPRFLLLTVYDGISEREREVLQLLTEGKGNKEIADLMNLSIRTVEAHRASVMEKLGVNNLAELIKAAIKKGLIDVNET